MGFNCFKTRATLRRQFTLKHLVPRNSWYSFNQPREDERLSRPWCHPMLLTMRLLDWESSILTTRPLRLTPSFPKCWIEKKWTIQYETFSKLKQALCEYWTLIKIKISMICVSKEYEIKTKMAQEQWLQLKMTFLSFYRVELTFGVRE